MVLGGLGVVLGGLWVLLGGVLGVLEAVDGLSADPGVRERQTRPTKGCQKAPSWHPKRSPKRPQDDQKSKTNFNMKKDIVSTALVAVLGRSWVDLGPQPGPKKQFYIGKRNGS